MAISHIKNTVLRRVVVVVSVPVLVPIGLLIGIAEAGYKELTEAWPAICHAWDGERRYR